MQRIRIKLNSGGVRTVLNSAGVRGDLARRARAIAAAAGDGHEVHVGSTGKRARAEVVTVSFDAMRREARDRNLTRAIGSGR